ncbi:hypothetical protein [Azospirillum doebereinerae]
MAHHRGPPPGFADRARGGRKPNATGVGRGGRRTCSVRHFMF